MKDLRVFISADMEGISGIALGSVTDPGDREYERARALMTADVNAAIAGALDGGATEIWVRDAHDNAANLLVENLRAPARVLQGWGGVPRMMEGVDDGFDAVLLVGYHARAMTDAATAAHTMSGQIRGLWFNGVEVGESGISAAHAGFYGVPVVFVSGDDTLAEEVHTVLYPGIEAVAVKSACRRNCVWLLPPEEAHQKIQAGVARALARRDEIPPYQPELPLEVKLQFYRPGQAHAASLVPTVQRVDECTVAARVADGLHAASLVSVLLRVAG